VRFSFFRVVLGYVILLSKLEIGLYTQFARKGFLMQHGKHGIRARETGLEIAFSRWDFSMALFPGRE